MIVYVESNFVLELAFLQEEYESCQALLRLAESQDIHHIENELETHSGRLLTKFVDGLGYVRSRL